eukprot:12521229-Alexandrium_andersonii.AAC.1
MPGTRVMSKVVDLLSTCGCPAVRRPPSSNNLVDCIAHDAEVLFEGHTANLASECRALARGPSGSAEHFQ